MANTYKANLKQIVKYYLSWQGNACRLTLQERLLKLEESQYAYLPDSTWMLRAGYTSVELGVFLFAKYGEEGAVYKVEVLSQTSRVLLFREAYFLASQVVECNEQLVAFLQEHRLPVPACE
jgi:hypothetical protein